MADFICVEKGIYKRGEYSFQVKMMVSGHRVTETFDTLTEARAFRDSKNVAKALDPDFKRVIAARIKKNEAASFTISKEALNKPSFRTSDFNNIATWPFFRRNRLQTAIFIPELPSFWAIPCFSGGLRP